VRRKKGVSQQFMSDEDDKHTKLELDLAWWVCGAVMQFNAHVYPLRLKHR